MTVRAKFKVNKIERTEYSRSTEGGNLQFFELQTIVMNPIYSNEKESENRKFWESSPTGEIRLGTINKSAADYFELGKEYYIDFKKVGE